MVGKPPFYFFGDWFVIIVMKTFDKLSVSGTVGGPQSSLPHLKEFYQKRKKKSVLHILLTNLPQ